jgi:hypothetical protein
MKRTLLNEPLGREYFPKPGDWHTPRQHPWSLRWYARITTNEARSYGFRSRAVFGNSPEDVVKKIDALREQFDLPKRKADAL